MTLDEIHSAWEKDSPITDNKLDEVSAQCPMLHAKYLSWYTAAKMALKRRQMQYDVLEKEKWLWFNGKLTKPEMDAKGWPYDPFNGMTKPLKGEMEMWYRTDPDMSKLLGVIEYQKILVDTIEEILKNITWRHSTIRNCIDWKRFQAGN